MLGCLVLVPTKDDQKDVVGLRLVLLPLKCLQSSGALQTPSPRQGLEGNAGFGEGLISGHARGGIAQGTEGSRYGAVCYQATEHCGQWGPRSQCRTPASEIPQGSRGPHSGHPAAAPHLPGVLQARGYADLEPACLRAHVASSGVPRRTPRTDGRPAVAVTRGEGGVKFTQGDGRVYVSACRTELETGEKRWPRAFICPLPRTLKMFHMVRGQVYGKGPGFGVRDMELRGPRQVTPLEPQFRCLQWR